MIKYQIPEHIRTTSPAFVGFMELYYEYLNIRKNSSGIINSWNLDSDIDNTLDEYIDKFYSQYGQHIPVNISLSRRDLLKLLNEVYSAKGTEQSFKILFRVLFNMETEYQLPSERILKASDGVWVQESFIHVDPSYNNILGGANVNVPNNTVKVYVSGEEIQFEATRFDSITGNVKIYFKSTFPLSPNIGDDVIVTNAAGVIVVKGNIINTLTGFTVADPGAKFIIGQVFKLADTVLRIKNTDDGSGIKFVETVVYGNTALDTSYTLSPFIDNTYSPKTVINLTDALGRAMFGIQPEEDLFFNTFIGSRRLGDIINVGAITQATFLEFNSWWSGIVVALEYKTYIETVMIPYMRLHSEYAAYFTNETDHILPESVSLHIPKSQSDYDASVGVITPVYGTVSKLVGRYNNVSGHLSDSYNKLHDSYYYQIFSYILSSNVDISKYKNNILALNHPAGLKNFSNLNRSIILDTSPRTIALSDKTFSLNLTDSNSFTESWSKSAIKSISTMIGYSAQYADSYFAESYALDDTITESLGNNINVSFAIDQVTFGSEPVFMTLGATG